MDLPDGLPGRRHFPRKTLGQRLCCPICLSYFLVCGFVGSVSGSRNLCNHRPGDLPAKNSHTAPPVLFTDFSRGFTDIFLLKKRVPSPERRRNQPAIPKRERRLSDPVAFRFAVGSFRNPILPGHPGSRRLPQPSHPVGRKRTTTGSHIDEPNSGSPRLALLPNLFRQRPERFGPL